MSAGAPAGIGVIVGETTPTGGAGVGDGMFPSGPLGPVVPDGVGMGAATDELDAGAGAAPEAGPLTGPVTETSPGFGVKLPPAPPLPEHAATTGTKMNAQIKKDGFVTCESCSSA